MVTGTTKWQFPLVALILVNLLLGAVLLPGFGESVDELSQNLYAERTIQAIQSLASHGTLPASFLQEEPKQGSHGPAFIVGVTLLRDLLLPGADSVGKLNFGHFLYFLAFQVGIVSIFFLARRWVSDPAAFGAALLFNTQPILLGHAFMNPKDVVFMSLLCASAALGLWMVDKEGQNSPQTVQTSRDRGFSFLKEFRRGEVWLAGLMLGFSSAIRMAAPLVGLVVLVHAFMTKKWRALPRVLAYGLIAMCFMVLFWPYLWPNPPVRLLGSLLNSAHYPDVHITLFKGTLFDARDIPRSYLPTLLLVQLTETTLGLILLGIIYLIKKIRWDLAALVLLWFALPAALAVLLQVNLYNNFRQVFFILPPLFLLAGLGLEWLFTLVRRPLYRYLIIILVLLPGLYANINLYPYQYIYYNQLVGGVSGAYRNYELDYWDLAFREAQIYVNKNASPNANIYADKSKYAAQTFARPDLIFNTFGAKNFEKYAFIIVSTAGNADERFAEYPTVFVVERDGVPLAYVKKP